MVRSSDLCILMAYLIKHVLETQQLPLGYCIITKSNHQQRTSHRVCDGSPISYDRLINIALIHWLSLFVSDPKKYESRLVFGFFFQVLQNSSPLLCFQFADQMQHVIQWMLSRFCEQSKLAIDLKTSYHRGSCQIRTISTFFRAVLRFIKCFPNRLF